MNIKPFRLTAALALLLLCFTAVPQRAAAYTDMTISAPGLELIKRYESFSPTRYEDLGNWYIGYGTLISPEDYVDTAITADVADMLLRDELKTHEKALNSFFSRYQLEPSQTQFDALVSFTYNAGSAWMNGSSDLLKLVRGELPDISRLDTIRAFGVWSHSGGKVLSGLAERRIEEAVLYLDGTPEDAEAYSYLAINKDDSAAYKSDFAVYERGATYDAFPAMLRLGWHVEELRAADGRSIRLGDVVGDSAFVTPVWKQNVYTGIPFEDVADTAWYYHYVMELSEQKVVNGRGVGVFAPAESVTVAEALKLVLLAAGNEAQEPTAEHWAGGYAALARELGCLPDGILDHLDQPITRRSVARLATKAMGFGQSFNDTPFTDVDDGYATAMSDLGIMAGSKNADGEPVFYPNDPLTRAEAAAIVWRIGNAAIMETKQTVRYSSRDLRVVDGVPLSSYDRDGFSGSGVSMSYSEPGVTVRRGIDVSRFQGAIDWAAVKAQGFDFVIMRVGGRYQQSGEIYDDRMFEEYYAGAHAAGIQTGVYFYSQAINVGEAIEEADYIFSKIEDKTIDGPIVFDWESAGIDSARTAKTPTSVITDCAIAFCEQVKSRGYTPMVYMMRYDGYMRYDLTRLLDYGWWYAGEYKGAYPKFFYDFQMWQYTSSGRMDGVEGDVDMDLWFIREPKAKPEPVVTDPIPDPEPEKSPDPPPEPSPESAQPADQTASETEAVQTASEGEAVQTAP